MSNTMNDPNQKVERLIRMGPSKPRSQETNHAERSTLLGIELPFDWCLVRGRELRKLQSDLRRARFDAAMRLRSYANLLKENIRKDSR